MPRGGRVWGLGWKCGVARWGCAYAQCVTAASSKVSAVAPSTSNNVSAVLGPRVGAAVGFGASCSGGASFTVSSASSAIVKGMLCAGARASILKTALALEVPYGVVSGAAGPEVRSRSAAALF